MCVVGERDAAIEENERLEQKNRDLQACHESELGVCFQHCEEVKGLTQALNRIDALTLDRNVMAVVEIKDIVQQALKGVKNGKG